MKKMNAIIENVKNEYAPDKRVALFDIQLEKKDDRYILSGETNLPEGLAVLVTEFRKVGIDADNKVNVLPDTNLADRIYGIVNLSVANIRSKPSHPAELATQALLGTVVNVLKKENGWYLIQTPDMYISWVDDDGIKLADSSEIEKWTGAEKVIITKNVSFVYEKPLSSSDYISDLVAGNLLKFIDYAGNFVEIEFPDGRTGYVSKSDIKLFSEWLKNNRPEENSIIESAMDFMGLPYLWGGTSTKGVDCSGFTKTVYFMNGVIIPRDASQQVHIGQLADSDKNFSQLKKGDLLFFGNKETENSKERITHVAIYLGDNKYIHSAGRVRINSLDKNADDFNKYRYDTYIRSKRVLGNYTEGENLIINNNFYR